MQLLLKNGAEINAIDSRGETTLHKAAGYGKYEIVRLLLDRGASINARDNCGRTPLFYAIPHESAVQLLLARRANPESTDDQRDTPLHIAAKKTKEWLMRKLVKLGADPNIANQEGKIPEQLYKEAVKQNTGIEL